MKNAKDLVPKYNNAKLNRENHLGIWPLSNHRPYLDDKRPNLYSVDEPAWKLIGWCECPFYSSRDYTDSLVFERMTESNPIGYYEIGDIYWIHCNVENMNIVTEDKED